jgi:hypothetical protein
MTIYPIHNEPIPGNIHRVIPAGSREGPGERTNQEIGNLQGKDSFIQNYSMWAELQEINDSSNELAQKERNGEKISRGVEEYVDRMRAHLERIIKNFPPFPPGGEERIKLLREYAGFRKLIDQLTIPPPEKSVVGAETSRVLSPADSLPGANQPGEKTLGNLGT